MKARFVAMGIPRDIVEETLASIRSVEAICVPFTALGRANGWSTKQLVRTTFLCGFAHVTVTAILEDGGQTRITSSTFKKEPDGSKFAPSGCELAP